MTKKKPNKDSIFSKKIKLLLVEDNYINQQIYSRIFDSTNYQITIASNGEEAIELVKQLKFDMIFMDCIMEGMNGFDTAKAIRKLETSNLIKQQKIIAVTNLHHRHDIKKCIESGMDDYVIKPIREHDFSLKIQKWLL